MRNRTRNNSNTLAVIFAVLITAVISGAAVYFYMGEKAPVITVPTKNIEEVKDSKNEATLYENENFGFSLEIPTNWGELDISVENPEDPGEPEAGKLIMLVLEKITITSKEDARKSFVINVYDLSRDYTALGDGATGQSVLYDKHGDIGVDLWIRYSANLVECNFNASANNISEDICDEENEIVDEIVNNIGKSFKRTK